MFMDAWARVFNINGFWWSIKKEGDMDFKTYQMENSGGVDYDELICMAQQLRAIWEGWANPLTHLFEQEDSSYIYEWIWESK